MRPYRRLCLDPKAHLRPILLHLRPARHKETHETRDTRHETRKVVELGCWSTAAARIVRLAGSRAAAPRLMRSQALLERPHADHRVPAVRGRWVWPPSQRLRERAACWCPFFSRMCVDGLVQRAEFVGTHNLSSPRRQGASTRTISGGDDSESIPRSRSTDRLSVGHSAQKSSRPTVFLPEVAH